MKVIVLALLITLASCATPYQQSGYRGGFSESPIAQDTYEVNFQGNGYTGQQLVRDYLKRRCAELTIEMGHTHYIVLGGNSTLDTSLASYNGNYQIVNKPGATAIIRLTSNPPADVLAYDAYMVIGKRNPASEATLKQILDE